MKRITFFATIIGMMVLQSCTVNQVQDPAVNQTLTAEVFEVTRSFTTGNNFSNLVTFPHTIYASDMVLAYRLDGVVNGTDVWKQMPQTYFYSNGTMDFRYDFDFTRYDISLYMEGNNLQAIQNQYRINQVFRIVIVPGSFTHKMSVNTNDYNSVFEAYNIDTKKIINLK
jgi:hypothetical protein